MKPTLSVLLGICGLRSPRTAVTIGELALLLDFVRGARSVVEVGVSEGGTSERLLDVMSADGRLVLVDPYLDRLRLETWLRFSATEMIARRAVRRFAHRACFVRLSSQEAARTLELEEQPSLIFLDARHDYLSVSEDLKCWAPLLADGGVIAVHDCVPCASRPELRPDDGGCRAVGEAEGAGWARIATTEALAILRPPPFMPP